MMAEQDYAFQQQRLPSKQCCWIWESVKKQILNKKQNMSLSSTFCFLHFCIMKGLLKLISAILLTILVTKHLFVIRAAYFSTVNTKYLQFSATVRNINTFHFLVLFLYLHINIGTQSICSSVDRRASPWQKKDEVNND